MDCAYAAHAPPTTERRRQIFWIMSNEDVSELRDHRAAARRLRVPGDWLKREIESGRLPGLRAGAKFLLHVPTIERLLIERASSTSSTEASDATP